MKIDAKSVDGRKSIKIPGNLVVKLIYSRNLTIDTRSTMARFEFPRNPSILGIFVGYSFYFYSEHMDVNGSMVPSHHRSIELLSRISPFFADGFPSSLPRDLRRDGCHIRKKWLCSGGLLYAFRWKVAN